MQTYDIAHIREQGVDLIIIPVDSSFGIKSIHEQNILTHRLQSCSKSSGLSGTVVPVWDSGGGRMSFVAPQRWHPFFSSITLDFVFMNINRRIICG